MSDVRQVKVDNWGIYFLQRLKHFFNRTDFCDLTLQFQDNSQLKVHRLVLNACTEYFELLERTCEMYEDRLVMPDDLQADVVVPIVNFMYTGQLEFKQNLLEKLYQTSQIMNVPVLTKLLDAPRSQLSKTVVHSYSRVKRTSSKKVEVNSSNQMSNASKRPYTKAFNNVTNQVCPSTPGPSGNNDPFITMPLETEGSTPSKKISLREPRPTRYELPEEFETDNICDSSFSNISYTSKPLMVHPNVKQYSSKKKGLFSDGSSNSKFINPTSTLDIVECKKISKNDIFEDMETSIVETEMFPVYNLKECDQRTTNQLFDQIIDVQDGPKVIIDTKDTKATPNLDHAKIISEVLKKYPHLIKGNKNIKLKVLDTPKKNKKQQLTKFNTSSIEEKPANKNKIEVDIDSAFESEVLDSIEAAKLIAMGADNVKGPWICLICGAPGRALHFTSYYNFRRHLVEVHNEKPVMTRCEYCGLKSTKRNYLLHHLLTKHGIKPPPSYNFPKCNHCNYIALTEALLVKHKVIHSEARRFSCNVCNVTVATSSELLHHIQATGHKYSAERKTNIQCIYCLKVFLRTSSLYAHIKTHHKEVAKNDGIIEDSDEETNKVMTKINNFREIKYEPSTSYETDDEIKMEYEIQQQADGNMQIIPKKVGESLKQQKRTQQKILNTGYSLNNKIQQKINVPHTEFISEERISSPCQDEIVMIDNNEYILRDNQLIPKSNSTSDEIIISDIIDDTLHTTATTSAEYTNIHHASNDETLNQNNMIMKDSRGLNQPLQIVVSNEEEYKALMANHPIIFDNGEDKTMTVLTTPHSTTLNTTSIDLNQSSNMMIIQDNYPLNVSENVAPDNSNIVVVYSHAVEDSSKPFEIITPQSIGSQYVQSSSIIQNFQTVTTSAPVVTAQYESQSVEDWHDNVQENLQNQQVIISSETESLPLQNSQVIQHDEITKDLPDVEITTEISQPSTEVIHESTDETCIVVDNQFVEQQNSDEVIKQTEDNMNSLDGNVIKECKEMADEITISTQEQPFSDNIPDQTMEIVVPIELSHDEKTNKDDVEPLQTAIVQPLTEQNNLNDTIIEEVGIAKKTDDVSINIQESKQNLTDTANDATSITEHEPTEKILRLTSEWSEDEDEVVPNNDEKAEGITDNLEKNNGTQAPSNSHEDVEESIENIQQEVEKQMTNSTNVETETQDNGNNVQDASANAEPDHDKSEKDVDSNAIVKTQENISSLLNDWEDNSQEENPASSNNTPDPNTQDSESITNPSEAVEVTVNNKEPTELKKDDNIKKLVSDWDDDDEEENKGS